MGKLQQNQQVKQEVENLINFKTNMNAVGDKLKEVTGLDEAHIHFQPKGTQELTYPCIVFELNYLGSREGDNIVYGRTYSYNVTYISHKSTDEVVDKLHNCEFCSFMGQQISDNLYHFRFRLNGNLI